MLVNSRKVTCRLGNAGLVLLAVLALSSCGKKADQPPANNTSSQSTGQSSAPASSTTASKDQTATSASKSTTSKSSSSKSSALSAEAQKLGVKPTGSDCPSNAPIKGNLNKGKKLYHQTKDASYKGVKPEICFADAATAQKAGFSAPKGAK
ncbi:MAG: hypothetical protein M3O33_09530 [Cyanobacteriota bacterium]|nr:hypothetical protein [Cyanobacteriota bacterium]